MGSVQLTGREEAGLGRGSGCSAVWVGSSDPLGGSEVGVTLWSEGAGLYFPMSAGHQMVTTWGWGVTFGWELS